MTAYTGGIGGLPPQPPSTDCVIVPTPPGGLRIDDVIPAGPNVIALSGDGFDTLGRFRVIDDFGFDEFFYDSSGPNAGLNPPGATVTVYSPTSAIIGYLPMGGLTITQVHARDGADAVVSEWYGSAVVETTPSGIQFIAYTSPASQTLRLEAVSGLLSGGAVRLLMSFSNGTLFASNPNDPNEAATNAGNGITVIEWTDTAVEVQSPFIPNGTALGVAVQADLAVTIDEWLNTSLEGPSGFAPFVAIP